MKKSNSLLSVMMIILIMFIEIAPVISIEAESKVVHITDADDLYRLSEDCSYDRWSKDKTVVLDGDIDLKGEKFPPIPIFGGVFDGQGHTIRGLLITSEGSNRGFFRYLEDGGIIKNLNVEGEVTPEGERKNIGGIVGNNSGILENCTFSGLVKGKEKIGGLVGWNNNTGQIVNSSMEGTVYGENMAGGIAGYNGGVILCSTNKSDVNITVEEYKLDFEDITLENINLTKFLSGITDIGGIAGVNTGVIQSSENYGIIGYPSVGYNIGGIAGRQSGYILKSINNGTIYGRKEVAGIVGQMEPHISLMTNPSKLKQLKNELSSLQLSITNLINNTKTSSDIGSDDLSSIQKNISDGKGHVQSLIDQTESLINKDIEEINKINIIAIEALEQLIPVVETLEEIPKIMEDVIIPLREAMVYFSKAMTETLHMSTEFDELSGHLDDIVEKIELAKKQGEESCSLIKAGTDSLMKGNIEETLNLFRSAKDKLVSATDNIKSAFNRLENVGDSLVDMMSSMGQMSKHMKEALDAVLEAIDTMRPSIKKIENISEKVKNLIAYLTEEAKIEFKTTDDQYQETKEGLFSSVDDIVSSLSMFISNMNAQGNILMDSMQSVNDKLFSVMNSMLNIVEEVTEGEIEIEDIVKDVSVRDIEKKTEGKVSECKNFGTVEADLNVGGIAGAMAIELKFDQEEELDLGQFGFNVVFETRAIVSRSENYGNITGKKNNVGGIAGKMDLGYIHDCVGAGTAKSTDGNYVGGIAGNAMGPIVSSYSKSRLEGGNYIGGVAGYGAKITDCYALVDITRSGSCVGAICGDIEANNTIKKNYFVSDTLHGIDGISYMDRAEPISYEDLIIIDNIPEIFKEFSISFWLEDRLVDTINFNYGDPMSQIKFPEILSKRGYYTEWDKPNIENLKFDTEIYGRYIPYLTVLESKEKRDGSLPILLVEGSFTGEDSLSLTEDKSGSFQLKKAIELEQWIINIPEDGNAAHNIRYLPPQAKKNLEVYIHTDGKWAKTKSKWDGKYLVFESYGNNIRFSIMDKGNSYMKYVFISAGAVVAIIIFVLYLKRKRKGRDIQEDSATVLS